MLGNSLRSGIGTIFEKTPDDQAAHFLLGAIATGIVKHVAHELADDGIFLLLQECPQPVSLRAAAVVIRRIVNIAAVKCTLASTVSHSAAQTRARGSAASQ